MQNRLHEVLSNDPAISYQLEWVRCLRNTVRKFMTGNTKEISMNQQNKWFKEIDHETFKVYIYTVKGRMAGYGIVRVSGERVLLTGALDERWRGQGLGKDLFKKLMSEATSLPGVISLEVNATNSRAINLYKTIGFTQVEYDLERDVIIMEIQE